MAVTTVPYKNRAAAVIELVAFLCGLCAFFSVHLGTIDFGAACIILIALGLAVFMW